MNFQKNFVTHGAGILILFVFIAAVMFSGCVDTGKGPVSNESQDLTNTGGEIEAGCGGINEACCENNTCNSSGIVLACIGNKCVNFNVTNISTEKPRYTANELIKISVTIDSTADMNNVSLRVYGITSRQKKHLIDQTRNLNLIQGINVQNFTVKAPTCTHGCGARYYPDDYPLYAEISRTDEITNISISAKNQINVNLY